jgi:hypothetical protein
VPPCTNGVEPLNDERPMLTLASDTADQSVPFVLRITTLFALV